MSADAFPFIGTSVLFAYMWLSAMYNCDRELRKLSATHKHQLAAKHITAFRQGLTCRKKTEVLTP